MKMKIHILYRPKSEHATTVESYVRDFARRGYTNMTLLSLDTREGSAEAALYDIMSYPAILAIADDGSLQKLWQGDELPLMDELSSYARA